MATITTRAYGEDQFGFVVTNDDGSVQNSPLFMTRREARAEARKMAKDLGDIEVINDDGA